MKMIKIFLLFLASILVIYSAVAMTGFRGSYRIWNIITSLNSFITASFLFLSVIFARSSCVLVLTLISLVLSVGVNCSQLLFYEDLFGSDKCRFHEFISCKNLTIVWFIASVFCAIMDSVSIALVICMEIKLVSKKRKRAEKEAGNQKRIDKGLDLITITE